MHSAVDAIEALRSFAPEALVVDVEPFVCLWDTDDRALAVGLQARLADLADVPSAREVVFITNSKRRPSGLPQLKWAAVRYVSGARKPFLNPTLARSLPRPVVVCGDQVLTDGILAWRLNAPFVQLWLPFCMPVQVRVQRSVGEIVAPLFFKN